MPVRPYDQNQQFLLPPSLNEWVRTDHPARVFSDLIDRLDTSGFQEIKPEGRPRYETKMMLKALLWSYAHGIRASRKIEERLSSDVVFMWLAGLEQPDFRTICLFRRTNLERLNYLFSEVILLAKGLGLLRLGLIALDGTKMRAQAGIDSFKQGKDWVEELKKAQEEVKRILAEAEAADLADDAKYGTERRGDELPQELTQAELRVQRIEHLINHIKSAQHGENHWVSMTDPEAKFMHYKDGSIPAYNAEVAVTEDQLIVYSDVTTEPVDTNQLVPALEGIKHKCGAEPKQVVADAGFNSGKNLKALEDRQVDGYIAESGEENIGQVIRSDSELYGKEDFQYDQMSDCYICPVGERLLPRQRHYHRTRYSGQEVITYRPEREVCLRCRKKNRCTRSDHPMGRSINRMIYEAERFRMRQKLKTERGKEVYKKRKIIVEPVIGQLRIVGGFIQFLLRGLLGAKIEWKWATMAHNILKMTRKVLSGEVKLAFLSR